LSFFPRVINYTDIDFSKEEFALLNKGLKIYLSHKPKDLVKILALELTL
jgi:hypothetical protein